MESEAPEMYQWPGLDGRACVLSHGLTPECFDTRNEQIDCPVFWDERVREDKEVCSNRNPL